MSIKLGRRIRKARKALGIKQREMADLCGVERHSIARYEAGKYEPSAGVMLSLAKALAVDPMYLLEASTVFERLPELGQRLFKARMAKGLKQWQIGALCGLSGATISRYETGRYKPSARTLRKLAATLQVKSQYLMEAYKGGERNER